MRKDNHFNKEYSQVEDAKIFGFLEEIIEVLHSEALYHKQTSDEKQVYIEKLQQEVKDLLGNQESLKKVVDALNDKNKEIAIDKAALKQDKEVAIRDKEAALQDKAVYVVANQSLNGQIIALQKAQEKAREDYEALKRDYEELSQRYIEQQKQRQGLEEENKKLKEKNEQLALDFRKNYTELVEQKKLNEELLKENKTLEELKNIEDNVMSEKVETVEEIAHADVTEEILEENVTTEKEIEAVEAESAVTNDEFKSIVRL